MRKLSIFMAAVMSGVLLAGCSSASTDNAAQTTAAQSEAAGTETSAEGESVTEAAADVDDELAQIQKSGVFKVGVEGTYPPMTYHDESGELTGFDVEVAKKVAEKLGVTAEFTESDWDSLLAGIDSKRLDTVINAVSVTEERSQKYDFAGPYFYITQQIVVRSDDDSIVDMDSLNGKKCANTMTTAYLDLLEDAGAEIVPINTTEEAVSMINSGRADFTTFNSVIFNEYLKQHPDAKVKVAFAIPDLVDTYAVPIRKGETRLLEAVQSALDELAAEGTLSEISEQYFETDFTKPVE